MKKDTKNGELHSQPLNYTLKPYETGLNLYSFSNALHRDKKTKIISMGIMPMDKNHGQRYIIIST